jgi:hypothetical protein
MNDEQRGAEAAQLLNNPLFKQSFEGVRQKLLERLEETAIGDVDTQHQLTLCLQTVKQVRRYLENYVRDGELEAARAVERKRLRKEIK